MKVVYVCDIDEDIDDVIAVEWLHINNYLDCVVLDRPSSSSRIKDLKDMGVIFKETIPKGTEFVFCGGALTKVAEYLEEDILDTFVCNGGFCGSNVISEEDQLKKFKGNIFMRTFNLNLDPISALKVFNSNKIKCSRYVTKNVCHDIENTYGKIHKDSFLEKYNLKSTKRLHDLLMVKEGICLLMSIEDRCGYVPFDVIYEASELNKDWKWGTELNEASTKEISTIFI